MRQKGWAAVENILIDCIDKGLYRRPFVAESLGDIYSHQTDYVIIYVEYTWKLFWCIPIKYTKEIAEFHHDIVVYKGEIFYSDVIKTKLSKW